MLLNAQINLNEVDIVEVFLSFFSNVDSFWSYLVALFDDFIILKESVRENCYRNGSFNDLHFKIEWKINK